MKKKKFRTPKEYMMYCIIKYLNQIGYGRL